MSKKSKYLGLPVASKTHAAAKIKESRQSQNTSNVRWPMINGFVDAVIRELSRNELAVWLIIFRDSRNGLARTGQSDIARRAGVCVRTVRRTIRKLERRGLLIVVFRGGLNRGPSTYRIKISDQIDFNRTSLCPITRGQNEAGTRDTLLSAIP